MANSRKAAAIEDVYAADYHPGGPTVLFSTTTIMDGGRHGTNPPNMNSSGWAWYLEKLKVKQCRYLRIVKYYPVTTPVIRTLRMRSMSHVVQPRHAVLVQPD